MECPPIYRTKSLILRLIRFLPDFYRQKPLITSNNSNIVTHVRKEYFLLPTRLKDLVKKLETRWRIDHFWALRGLWVRRTRKPSCALRVCICRFESEASIDPAREKDYERCEGSSSCVRKPRSECPRLPPK
jgi:hypothetical protein